MRAMGQNTAEDELNSRVMEVDLNKNVTIEFLDDDEAEG
jgi:hypothetical protein